MASKFVLVLYLGRHFGLFELGLYGLIATTIVLGLQLLGLDFYVYNTREILKLETSSRPLYIRDQGVVHLIAYSIVLPLLLSVFLIDLLPWVLIGVFYLLVILEHLSQEISRLLTTLSAPIMASFILFCRTGLWIFIFILVDQTIYEIRTIEWLLWFWVAGSFISVLVGCLNLSLRKEWDWLVILPFKPNWKWIKKGLGISVNFFLATLALQSIELSDRYFLKHYYGEEIVGIYIFSQNIAGVIQVAIVTGLVMVITPRMIEAYYKGNIDEYHRYNRYLSKGIVLSLAVLAFFIIPLYPFLAKLMEKPEIVNNLHIFYILFVAMVLSVLALIPYYGLYVMRCDRELLFSMLFASGVNVMLNIMLIPRHGMEGASIATLMAFLFLLCIRYIYLLKRATKV